LFLERWCWHLYSSTWMKSRVMSSNTGFFTNLTQIHSQIAPALLEEGKEMTA
jgi:hypothetical protein